MMLTVTGGGMTSSQQAAGLAGSRYKQKDRQIKAQTRRKNRQVDKEKEKTSNFWTSEE